MEKITYPQKFAGNLFRATEANQIKSVVNATVDELTALVQASNAGVFGYSTKSDMDSDTSKSVRTLALVTNDPLASNNGYYRWDGAEWVESDFNFNFSEIGITKEFFVSEDGIDDTQQRSGKSWTNTFKTIKFAVSQAQTYIDNKKAENPNGIYKVSIRIATGFYEEEGSITLPPFTSLIGTDLRSVIIRPTEETKYENLFLLDNACYVYNLRFDGCVLDDLENPTKGFYFAFKQGAFITTSPYVQNCTSVNAPRDKFNAPLDPDNPTEPNPLVGKGGGGMLVDDTMLDPYSPLKSMIVDAYTQVNFNGIGICVKNRGYAQLVSFFTNFSRIGVLCLDGGHASLLNSNTTFGDFGLYSKGRRYLVEADPSNVNTETMDIGELETIKTNKKQIILDYMINELDNANTTGDYSGGTEESLRIRDNTLKDAGLFVDAIFDDLKAENSTRVPQFVQGLFTGKDTSEDNSRTLPSGAVVVFPINLKNDFLLSYDFLNTAIKDNLDNSPTLYTTEIGNKVDQLIDVAKNTLNSVLGYIDDEGNEIEPSDELVQEFGSLITSTSHDFSYAGSGVNFLGLPVNQNGIGRTNIEKRVVQEDGGRVYHSSGDEIGDFYVGNNFRIRQAEGDIVGRDFEKSVLRLVTGQILALGD